VMFIAWSDMVICAEIVSPVMTGEIGGLKQSRDSRPQLKQ